MIQDLQARVQDSQAEVQDLQAVHELLKASLDVGYLVGTPKKQAGVLLDGEWMDEG